VEETHKNKNIEKDIQSSVSFSSPAIHVAQIPVSVKAGLLLRPK
jgi:hypothetical protein